MIIMILIALAFCWTASAQSFRFAWLSDTHVGSPTGAEDLRIAVRDINMQNDVAFTVLSGDVAELGWNAELILAKTILDSLRKPYHIIPGNHDTKWSESGCAMFPRLWGADRFVFQHLGYLFIGLHQGPIMRMGDGHFAPEDLRWLDSAIAGVPDKTQPLIFVTHYPLDQSIDNWYEVLDRLKGLNVKAALVGHGHENHVDSFEGIHGIMGRSNLRGRGSEGGYTLVEIRGDSMLFSERRPVSGRTTTWHAITLVSQNDGPVDVPHPRPDFSVNQKYPDVRVRWTCTTGYTIVGAPAVWEDAVVVGDGSGTVYCLSLQDGSLRWRFASGSAVYSTPDVADGRVVFGSTGGDIFCVDANDGHLHWRYATEAPVVAAPRVYDGVVFIGASDGKFRAIDLGSGELWWAYDSVGAFVETRPLVHRGKVMFGAWDTYLYALNEENGALVWKWSNGRPTINLSPAACWPVAVENQVYIVAPDRYMTAIGLRDGMTVWRSGNHQVREAIGVSEDGSRVYAKSITDTLFCLLTSPKSLAPGWATSCGYGYDIDPSMPMEKEGSVYFGTKNGMVYSIEGRSGAVKWAHKVGVTIVNTPAPVSRDEVVITDFDGRIALLEDTGGSAVQRK